MNKTLRLLFVLGFTFTLLTSCSPPISDLVVILVVDTYTTAETDHASDDSCSVTPDGRGQQYGGKVSSPVELGAPHGTYVYLDVIEQIEKSEMFDSLVVLGSDFSGGTGLPSAVDSFIKRVDLYSSKQNSNQGILVVAVDTNELGFDDITSNISAAVDFFSQNAFQTGVYSISPARQFVVNMSFVFVPCDTQAFDVISPVLGEIDNDYPELGLSGIASMDSLGDIYVKGGDFYNFVNCLEEYEGTCRPIMGTLRERMILLGDNYDKLQPILQSEGISITEMTFDEIDDAMFNMFVVNLIHDPGADPSWKSSLDGFYNKLQEYLDVQLEIVYVGAAGNFGYEFSLPPASESLVQGVSSQASEVHEILNIGNGIQLAMYSNWGEVQMDGDFYADPMLIYGTSFAAPKFSVKVAQHMLLNSTCPMTFTSVSPNDPWPNLIYTCTP